MQERPLTPNIKNIGGNQHEQFSVEVAVCFFRIQESQEENKKSIPELSSGLEVTPEGLYSIPNKRINVGDSIEIVKNEIIQKHVLNKSALEYSDAVFSNVLDKPNRYFGDEENRICLIYVANIPDFSIDRELKWFSQAELIEILNENKFIKDHSQIITKAVFPYG